MFISDLFDHANSASENSVSEGQRKITKKNDPCWKGYHMVGTKDKGSNTVPNCVPGAKELDETADLADIVQARELIGRAVQNPQNEKHKYFEFLKHLRKKYGADYSTKIHQEAAKLAQAKESN
jgi:hypothetical protein